MLIRFKCTERFVAFIMFNTFLVLHWGCSKCRPFAYRLNYVWWSTSVLDLNRYIRVLMIFSNLFSLSLYVRERDRRGRECARGMWYVSSTCIVGFVCGFLSAFLFVCVLHTQTSPSCSHKVATFMSYSCEHCIALWSITFFRYVRWRMQKVGRVVCTTWLCALMAVHTGIQLVSQHGATGRQAWWC